MADVAIALAALVMGLVVVVKAPGTIRSGTPSARRVLASLASLAVALGMFVPAVVTWIADGTGLAHLNQPLGRSFVILAVLSGQSALGLSADPARKFTWLGSVGAAAMSSAIMAAMFVITPGDPRLEYASRPAQEPSTAVFVLAFLAYVTYAVATIMTEAWRYSRLVSPSTSAGLRLIAAGCVCCLGYAVVKGSELAGFLVGTPVPEHLEHPLGRGLAALGAVLVAAGCGVVSLSQRLAAVSAWSRDYRASLRLYPVWAELGAAVPGFAPEPDLGPAKDALRVRWVHERLYRRIVDLRDFWMDLRPYFDADVAAVVKAGLSPDDRERAEARTSAAVLQHAVLVAQQQILPVSTWIPESPASTTMDEEVRWWLAVAGEWNTDGPIHDGAAEKRQVLIR